MNSLTKQINSMFIFGYKGAEPDDALVNLVNKGLGGVIFFADNILDRGRFKKKLKNLAELQENKLILSVDQEGGRVERTVNLNDKLEYLSPLDIIKKPAPSIKRHYEILALELADFGFNMNFAPVLDIYTNPNDPIINERAFGKTVEDVICFSEIQNKSLKKLGIKTVGKHFPGHGPADIDSHVDMPLIDLSISDLECHILPFRKISTDAVMVSHVHYSAFDREVLPASLSYNIIEYLKRDVGFEGLIISDDMIMGGVSKYFNSFDACVKGILAGIDMFIFRESMPNLLLNLELEAKKNERLKNRIKESAAKIELFKDSINTFDVGSFDLFDAQKELEKIKNTPDE